MSKGLLNGKINNAMCNKNIKINFITQFDEKIGSTRIRIYNLLPYLRKLYSQVFVNADIYSADIIIFQKTINYNLLYKAKKLGKFICFDIDDLIPKMYTMIKYVDLVIVSTEYLKQELLKYNSNIIVIPNSLDIEKYEIPLKQYYNFEKPNIGWFGWHNNSYILDILNIRNLVTVLSDQSNTKYNVQTIDEDLKLFDFIIIPQEKNPNTLSKTNCRFLKAIYLGIPTFISDMPEYIKLAKQIDYPEKFIVKNIFEFKDIILKLKDNSFDVPSLNFNKIRKIILEKYSAETIADIFFNNLNQKYNTRNTNTIRNKKNEFYILFLCLKSFPAKLFSIKNDKQKIYKIITILGFSIKIKRRI